MSLLSRVRPRISLCFQKVDLSPNPSQPPGSRTYSKLLRRSTPQTPVQCFGLTFFPRSKNQLTTYRQGPSQDSLRAEKDTVSTPKWDLVCYGPLNPSKMSLPFHPWGTRPGWGDRKERERSFFGQGGISNVPRKPESQEKPGKPAAGLVTRSRGQVSN